MVFVAGPRQVGKTTMGLSLPQTQEGYLNWDIAGHRERILLRQLPPAPMWFFDELHKCRRWRDFLKGLFDGRPAGQRILVTGSARLEWYRYSGDSLQGRYHLLRLHPLSVAELGVENREGFDQLMQLGGFPEPFFSGSAVQARRWSREYRSLLVREEITALEQVRDLGTLELRMLRLPGVVGSPLSLNALREDLQVSHKTVAHWVAALESLYAVFRLAPFGSPRIRAIKQAQKDYHFDWSIVPEAGDTTPPRFPETPMHATMLANQHQPLGFVGKLNRRRKRPKALTSASLRLSRQNLVGLGRIRGVLTVNSRAPTRPAR